MRPLDESSLITLIDRLNTRLMQEAQMRARECARGLETPELGGLIIQKLGYGMAEAIKALEDVLGVQMPGIIDCDAATAVVDPNWRENMTARWQAQTGIDKSTPRPQVVG